MSECTSMDYVKSPKTGMNGSQASLKKCIDLGADGVLLNNIRMAVDFLEKIECCKE